MCIIFAISFVAFHCLSGSRMYLRAFFLLCICVSTTSAGAVVVNCKCFLRCAEKFGPEPMQKTYPNCRASAFESCYTSCMPEDMYKNRFTQPGDFVDQYNICTHDRYYNITRENEHKCEEKQKEQEKQNEEETISIDNDQPIPPVQSIDTLVINHQSIEQGKQPPTSNTQNDELETQNAQEQSETDDQQQQLPHIHSVQTLMHQPETNKGESDQSADDQTVVEYVGEDNNKVEREETQVEENPDEIKIFGKRYDIYCDGKYYEMKCKSTINKYKPTEFFCNFFLVIRSCEKNCPSKPCPTCNANVTSQPETNSAVAPTLTPTVITTLSDSNDTATNGTVSPTGVTVADELINFFNVTEEVEDGGNSTVASNISSSTVHHKKPC